MLETYKATLRGNQLDWSDEKPAIDDEKVEVDVVVTILQKTAHRTLRPYGLAEGQFVVPDDFDAPLPEEVLASFEQ